MFDLAQRFFMRAKALEAHPPQIGDAYSARGKAAIVQQTQIAGDYQKALRHMAIPYRGRILTPSSFDQKFIWQLKRDVFRTAYALTLPKHFFQREAQLETACDGLTLLACTTPSLFSDPFHLKAHSSNALRDLEVHNAAKALAAVKRFEAMCLKICTGHIEQPHILAWVHAERDRLEPARSSSLYRNRVSALMEAAPRLNA